LRLLKLSAILLLCLGGLPCARAEARLFVGEPYGHDAAFAGTGHAAVYLSGVCATTPVVLRHCEPGESGVVLSRYRGIGGYDWIAIPLIPYLYAVEKLEDVPLYDDRKLVAFLRDQYRRNHLESLVPDLPDGGTPGGDWYELIGASYLRTIYTFGVKSTPEQDEKLIRTLNDRSNRQHWNLITANCADFAREVLSIYYPHSVHRSIVGDLGVTTPKQMARTLSSYSRHHAELQTTRFVIPQVPGTIPRSKRVKGVFEVMLTAKKYMLPIFVVQPYAATTAVVVYVQHWHFNPGKNAPILDSNDQLTPPMNSSDRRTIQDQLDELVRTASSEDPQMDDRHWASVHAEAEPGLDASGAPTLQVNIDGEVKTVGVARTNILTVPAAPEFAAGLMEARLREELKSAETKKTARADIESDLALLQQLLTTKAKGLANSTGFAAESRNLTPEPTH
jgi:hypothetical protein